jgi:hypothetical protein
VECASSTKATLARDMPDDKHCIHSNATMHGSAPTNTWKMRRRMTLSVGPEQPDHRRYSRKTRLEMHCKSVMGKRWKGGWFAVGLTRHLQNSTCQDPCHHMCVRPLHQSKVPLQQIERHQSKHLPSETGSRPLNAKCIIRDYMLPAVIIHLEVLYDAISPEGTECLVCRRRVPSMAYGRTLPAAGSVSYTLQ